MPSYGSLGSPSLHKMDNRNSYGSRRRFDAGNIIGDPFALATISISVLAWIIAFVGSIIGSLHGGFPNYAWWALVYFFCCIIGITITVASDSENTYHVAISSYLAAGLVFTTSAVNSLVYRNDGAMEAAGAGFILLSMIAIVWIFYYGSQPSASHRTFVDSFALHKDRHSTTRSSRPMSNNYSARPQTSVTNQAPQMYTSAQLNGFETSSPVSGYPGGPAGHDQRSSTVPRFGNGLTSSSIHTPTNTQPIEPEVSAQAEYPYRAKAIYSYEANPDDANEISFTKHEILEVSDVSGRWWQAKKNTGETGIAPSNYLILL
ncbi:putative high osmolarity signaling protein Sho1 [Saccharata proteae CBS 121410]|uniref:High osmolarity signaling protein Sho1 n=1 Tax=Saccharata proteae CBS 121410 TaxID=1314787 RepID=A0A9P4LVL2_9PEZI|nr:putative high osmolarity signaling protein Sho1 [Saccharata proteae CBS 121410]